MSIIRDRAVVLGLCLGLLGAAAAAQDDVYFGTLHPHTVYSDGSGTPGQAFEMAKAAGLDFMAVTEHSHKSAEGAGDTLKIHIARDPTLYNGPQAASLISAAKRRTRDGEFVAPSAGNALTWPTGVDPNQRPGLQKTRRDRGGHPGELTADRYT